MGCNEHGVCIGNEALFSTTPPCAVPALTGMDLVRIGVERAATAAEAVDIICRHVAEYGVGGPHTGPGCVPFVYHNAFVIADRAELWHVETAGRCWRAAKISSGIHRAWVFL